MIRSLFLSALVIFAGTYGTETARSETEEGKSVVVESKTEPREETRRATVFFSTYDVGDTRQTDGSPCHGADGTDLCRAIESGEKPIALTYDIRKKIGASYGDSVRISGGKCPGIYVVRDNMGKRFRDSCVKRGGYCVKGDFARKFGKTGFCDGSYTVELSEE